MRRSLGLHTHLAALGVGGDVSEHLLNTDGMPHSTSRICIILLMMHSNTKLVIRWLSALQMRAAGHRALEQLARGHRAVRIQTLVGWILCPTPLLHILVYLTTVTLIGMPPSRDGPQKHCSLSHLIRTPCDQRGIEAGRLSPGVGLMGKSKT